MSRFARGIARVAVFVLACGAVLAGCNEGTPRKPAVTFTQIPEAAAGGPDRLASIAGRVTGARRGQRLVLFAKSGVWWVQPFVDSPFTELAPDGTWSASVHLGDEYAALLVDAEYRPQATVDRLPAEGGQIAAVAIVKGAGRLPVAPRKMLTFSGYEWEVRDRPSDRGGENPYDPANAWVDAEGALHLKLAQRGGRWTSAEVSLTRPLGYGTYTFVVRDVSQLDPVAAFSMFTWDPEGAEQNHRELDVEISRWGVPSRKNAQYVVQPYYVAANVARFAAPAGTLTHSWRWEPERASFRTVRGAAAAGAKGAEEVASHEFTAGVPTPGNETVRMNLYYFRHSPRTLQKEVEVVVEKFQYLP